MRLIVWETVQITPFWSIRHWQCKKDVRVVLNRASTLANHNGKSMTMSTQQGGV